VAEVCTIVQYDSMQVAGFDWDEGNWPKCARHGVSKAEIEEVFFQPVLILPDRSHSAAEPRKRAIGTTAAGRYVFVVFTVRDRGRARLIRPISARYMHEKEIKGYEEDNPDLSQR
jgi:uncharacterized DUF497 family protein